MIAPTADKCAIKSGGKFKKLTIEVNKDTYLGVKLFSSLFLVKNKNKAPIVGNKIKEERIGKFIILQSRKLIKQKNQVTLQMHIDIYIHFEIY